MREKAENKSIKLIDSSGQVWYYPHAQGKMIGPFSIPKEWPRDWQESAARSLPKSANAELPGTLLIDAQLTC